MAIGATRRPRMTSRSSVWAAPLVAAAPLVWSLTMRSGLLSELVVDGADAVAAGSIETSRCGTRSARVIAVERAGDGVANADPEQVDGAADEVDRRRGRVLGLVAWRRSSARAGPRGRGAPRSCGWPRAVGRAHSRRGRRECETTRPASRRLTTSCSRYARGHVLVGRDLRERRGPGPVVPPKLDHEPHAVLALRAERNRPRAVERRAVGGAVVGVFEPRSGVGPQFRAIWSGLSVRRVAGSVNRRLG